MYTRHGEIKINEIVVKLCFSSNKKTKIGTYLVVLAFSRSVQCTLMKPPAIADKKRHTFDEATN